MGDDPHDRHRPHCDAKGNGKAIGRPSAILNARTSSMFSCWGQFYLHRRETTNDAQQRLWCWSTDVQNPRIDPESSEFCWCRRGRSGTPEKWASNLYVGCIHLSSLICHLDSTLNCCILLLYLFFGRKIRFINLLVTLFDDSLSICEKFMQVCSSFGKTHKE